MKVSTMNAKMAAFWADQLMANQEAQGFGVLKEKYTDKMCCLGVLCEALGITNDTENETEQGVYETEEVTYRYMGTNNDSLLPHNLAISLGISDSGDLWAPDGDRLTGRDRSGITLADLNDDTEWAINERSGRHRVHHFTFSMIADIVRYNGGALLTMNSEVSNEG